MPIERGDVYWVRFDENLGEEIQKTRPAVVMSNNAANQVLNRMQVVPITSKTHRVYPGDAIIELRGEKRKAIASQIATASKLRFGAKLGALETEDIARVEAAIAVQLGLTLK
jgi:mRNA interferase MazF